MEERKFHVCHDCRARSPETDTNYTLISSRYGWRLTRHLTTDGVFVVEWRCPRCWDRRKRAKLPSTPPGEGVPAASELRSSRSRGESSQPPAKRTTRPPGKRR